MNIYTIYKAKNIFNNKVYIGFDSNWPNRQKCHSYNYKKLNKNSIFYNAIRKHGWDSFVWEVIYQSKDAGHCLNVMEPYFISLHESHGKGYNMTPGGEGKKLGSFENEITRRKKSIAHIGVKRSEESIKNQVASRKGYRHTEATKSKISFSTNGRKAWNKGLIGVQISTRKGVARPRCCCIICHKEVDDSNISRWHKHI